jgi:hypothetical protein
LAQLIAKKIEEGPKSEDGAVKLFMGNLSYAIQHEEDSGAFHGTLVASFWHFFSLHIGPTFG